MGVDVKTDAMLSLVTDLELTILYGNLRLQQLAATKEALAGKSLLQVFHFFKMAQWQQIKAHCEQHPQEPYSFQTYCCNNSSETINWVICPQLNKAGEIKKLQWIGTPQQTATTEETAFKDALLTAYANPVVMLDAMMRVKQMNACAEDFFGLSAAIAKGQCLHQILSFRPASGSEAEVLAALEERGSWEGRLHFINAKGKLRQCKCSIRKVFEQHQLIGYIAVHDAAVPKENEAALRRQNKTVQRIMHAINDQSGTLMWAADAENRLRYFNLHFAQTFGLQQTDINKPIAQLLQPEVAAVFLQKNNSILQADKLHLSFEETVLSDGKKEIYRTLSFPVKTSFGNFAAGIALDVSHIDEQKELLLQKTRYEQAALLIADVISDWDILADRFWRSEPNKGMPVHEKKAATMQERYERVHGEDIERFRQSLHKALHSDATNWECRYRYRQGEANNEYKVLHEKAVIMRNEAGVAVRMIAVVEDVTEQERLRHALRDKERQIIAATIEGQEAERNELARELHDNVGQVLAMCKLFVDIAADSVPHEFLNKCQDQLQKAIREIRSLSHRLSPETLDHKGLPEAIAELVDNINQTGKLHMHLQLSENLHTTGLCKTVQTTAYRIVQEKITNILKHAHASEANISLALQKDKLLIAVADNGKGFDPALVKAGIGLKNIYNRVEVAGGTALLQSSPGAGCSMNIELPVGEQA